VRRRAGGHPPPWYEFIGGKGGVGKTTTAAALALGAAGPRQRTLLVSTDPAHSLGDVLGRRVGARVTPVKVDGAELHALELDADRALAHWLRARRESLRLIAERGTYLDDADVDRFLGLSFPGVDELGGLLELTRVAEAGRYDTVVVDTAPTGHTLRLLAVPDALRRIAAVLGEMLAKHHFLLTRLAGRDQDDAADRLVAEIDAEAHRLAILLRDPRRCRFRWLVLPEMLAVNEARDAVRTLEAAGISIGEIVVNRAAAPLGGRRPVDRRRGVAERAAIAAVRSAFPDHPLRMIPELPEEPRGPAALRPLVLSLRTLLPAPRPLSRTGPSESARRGRPAARPRVSAVAWAPLVAPAGVRLLLLTGKGGVGKTTCAAAAALTLAALAPTRRILLLSTDPAHSLGDALTTPMSDDVRRVPGARGALGVRELDADRAFAVRRERYRAAVDQLFDAIRGDSRFDVAFDRAVVRDLLDLAPGGLDELCALLTVTEALFPPGSGAAASDLVIVDTAPTGHTLRLLALPGLALEWVRALLATLLKYRQVLGLGALAADLVELSRGLRQLQALLVDPRRARVVVVTRAAALPRLETMRLLARLDTLGLTVSALVVNAVRWTSDVPGANITRSEAAELSRLRAAARRRRPRLPVLLAPAIVPPPRGVDALRDWARTWTLAAS
jgi:arsenite-transporting ATPase